MLTPEVPGCRQPTGALRAGSREILVADLAAYMVASEPNVDVDYRDVLTGFPPFLDCSRRLGVDPIDVFEVASAGRSAGMVELAMNFAHRTDVVLKEWSWRLDDLPEGPCYRLAEEMTRDEFMHRIGLG
jgi:hypothetical protein